MGKSIDPEPEAQKRPQDSSSFHLLGLQTSGLASLSGWPYPFGDL